MLNSTTLVKPASMTERVWFLLLLLSSGLLLRNLVDLSPHGSMSVSQVVDSGVCISPQASWAPYCQPSYQVTSHPFPSSRDCRRFTLSTKALGRT
mmetsp:Transcript_23425/g.76156  ORF Transcript_23425/g.76156 Transcript_23425/m.76156 type:complete len:95 (-) Transcript_23425:614-898(-)